MTRQVINQWLCQNMFLVTNRNYNFSIAELVEDIQIATYLYTCFTIGHYNQQDLTTFGALVCKRREQLTLSCILNVNNKTHLL